MLEPLRLSATGAVFTEADTRRRLVTCTLSWEAMVVEGTVASNSKESVISDGGGDIWGGRVGRLGATAPRLTGDLADLAILTEVPRVTTRGVRERILLVDG